MVGLLVLFSIAVWLARGRSAPAFLRDFAKLLDRPQFARGLLSHQSHLRGELRGRKVDILLQYYMGKYQSMVVVSMETRATVTMEAHDFASWPDRESESALFGLEVEHDLTLRHRDGVLKAVWRPLKYFWTFPGFFPGPFEPTKWQSVLEKMHTVAGALERRAA
jgi:hypothetical protein